MKKLLYVSAFYLAACSASIDGGSPINPPPADLRPLGNSQDPLHGKLGNTQWQSARAIAFIEADGNLRVTIAQDLNLNCQSSVPQKPLVKFLVPPVPGRYDYSDGQGGPIINVLIDDSSGGQIGSVTIISSKSSVEITSRDSGYLHGNLAALSPLNMEPAYDLSGTFSARICNEPTPPAPPIPLSVAKDGQAAFSIAYSEAVKYIDVLGATNYDVRFMNKVPTTKCNPSNAWAMFEAPIKYLDVKVPSTTGPISISPGVAEYGDQGASTGWSTKYFEGSGAVSQITSTNVTINLDIKDIANLNLKATGTATVEICP